jgi:hypothetical protein
MTPDDRAARLTRMEQQAAASRRGGLRIQLNRSQQPGRSARRSMPPHEEKQRADDPLVYVVYGPSHPDVISGRRADGPDDPLVAQLKRRINSSGITRKEICAAFVGGSPGCLFENANQVYNLVYGLRSRPTITLECARRWLAVFGEQLGTFFQAADGNGWHDQLVRLRGAVAGGGLPERDMRLLVDGSAPPDDNDLLVMPMVEGPQRPGGDAPSAPLRRGAA